MTHLRIEGARLYAGAVTCSCGVPDCTLWHEEAQEVAGFTAPPRRDLAAMARRLREFNSRFAQWNS